MNVIGGSFNVGLGTLPSGYAGYLVNDTGNNMIALMLTSAIHPQPHITAFSVQSATNLVVSGVNGYANAPYSVVASTNVALPLAVDKRRHRHFWPRRQLQLCRHRGCGAATILPLAGAAIAARSQVRLREVRVGGS